jgi:hypothetical protein
LGRGSPPSRYAPGADRRFGELAASRWRPIHFRVGGCTNRIFRCHLLFLLSRFARFSREERPEGSLLAFAWSDFARGSTPIHSITERHSLFSSSSTRTAMDLPYGLSSQRERYGFTVFRSSARVG